MNPEERDYTDWARGLLGVQAEMLVKAGRHNDNYLVAMANEIGRIAQGLVEKASGLPHQINMKEEPMVEAL